MLSCMLIGTALSCSGTPLGNIYVYPQQRETTYIQVVPRTPDYSATSNDICEARKMQAVMFNTYMAPYLHCKAYNGASR